MKNLDRYRITFLFGLNLFHRVEGIFEQNFFPSLKVGGDIGQTPNHRHRSNGKDVSYHGSTVTKLHKANEKQRSLERLHYAKKQKKSKKGKSSKCHRGGKSGKKTKKSDKCTKGKSGKSKKKKCKKCNDEDPPPTTLVSSEPSLSPTINPSKASKPTTSIPSDQRPSIKPSMNPTMDFNLEDCETYSNQWLFDLGKTCDPNLEGCQCLKAEALIENGRINCSHDVCPQECPVCEYCLAGVISCVNNPGNVV